MEASAGMIANSPPWMTAVPHLLALTLPWILALFHLAGPVPADLGLSNGHLRPCPTAAHCAERSWSVSDTNVVMAALEQQLSSMPGTTVVWSDPAQGYVHATATSRLFGFVDDIELHSTASLGVIEARSESRLGDSDLGVNGRRLDQLEEVIQPAITRPQGPAQD